jgi:hypothetical protein
LADWGDGIAINQKEKVTDQFERMRMRGLHLEHVENEVPRV